MTGEPGFIEAAPARTLADGEELMRHDDPRLVHAGQFECLYESAMMVRTVAWVTDNGDTMIQTTIRIPKEQ